MSDNKETNFTILDDKQSEKMVTKIFKTVLKWINGATKSIVRNSGTNVLNSSNPKYTLQDEELNDFYPYTTADAVYYGSTTLDDYIKEGNSSNYTTLITLGAVNDGVTDNTETFKNAITYCKEKNKDLYIEQGTYLIKDRIVIDFPLRIQGSNIDGTTLLFDLPEPTAETTYDDTYWDESNSAFIIKSDNAAISNLTIKNSNSEDRKWNGVIFHYPKTKDDGTKFYASSERCELSNLNIKNFKSGIFIYGGWSRSISMSKILDCTYGIKYEALENINWSTSGDVISNCYIVGSKEYGLYANKTFETSIEGCIFEYNTTPIYCANALDTIFTNCWNEANTNGIEIDGNVRFVNGYNITNETVHQTENGIVFIEKPNDIMALRNNEVVFHQVDGIIVKGVSLGSKTINFIKNSGFGTIADMNFTNWTVDASSITKISNTETYKDNNSVFFDFHEGWSSDPFYGITTDAITIPKGDYKFSFVFKSPDRSTIDNKAKYLIMKLNSEGTVVDYLANEDFLPNGDNVWETVSKAISITDDTVSIKIKIQVNRNGLLYISSPIFADADISSDSLSLKDSGEENIITVVNQSGTEVDQIYNLTKVQSLEDRIKKIEDNYVTVDDSEEPIEIPVGETLPFKFGIDENGNYGYYKNGSDVLIPFSNGSSGSSGVSYQVGNTAMNIKDYTLINEEEE